MALIPNSHLSVLLFITLMLFSSYSSSSISLPPSEQPPTVYEILPKFGLPRGLLPDSVKSYTIDEDGYFEVELESPCKIQFENLVFYEEKISGKLSIGSITELVGVQVEKYFFWFDVDEIRVDLPPSDTIYFLVGFITKKLDAHQFEIVHSCQADYGEKKHKSLRKVVQLPAHTNDIEMLMTS